MGPASVKCPSQRDVHLIEGQIKGVKNGRDQLLVSVLQRCPSYRESNKGSQERQGSTLGVLFTVTVKRESTEIVIEIQFA